MSGADLNKDQLAFLALMAGNPAPHSFGCLQPSRSPSHRGVLVPAFGPPERWTHFQACRGGINPRCATLSLDDFRALNDAELIAALEITERGRAVLELAGRR